MATVSPRNSAAVCQVLFGGAAAAVEFPDELPVLRVAVPALGGDDCEPLVPEADSVSARDGVHLFHRPHLTGGFVVAPAGLSLEAAADHVYRRVFEATDGLHLYRLWNYVPRINGSEDHLENYRHFCRARSLAFEARFGRHFQPLLPASSAVGSLAGPLAVAFVAGPVPGRHFENPAQVPAFDYPAEHGPRPPSFSRATVATTAEATHVFISGTAAIRGHGTVAPGQLEPQLGCTLDNLRLIGEAAGIGAALGTGPAWQRRFKVYLRHAADLPTVVRRLESELFRPRDRVVYLNADICRTELVIEIEASLTRPA